MSARLPVVLAAALMAAALGAGVPTPLRAAGSEAAGAAPAADTIAMVNGKPLKQDLLDLFARTAMGRPGSELSEAQRADLLDALIRAEVIAQQAEKLGLHASSELDIPDATPAQRAFARLQTMNQAAFDAFAREQEPSEADLQAEYQRQIALVPHAQYHAHQMLVASEEAGNRIIKQLAGGTNFETLARQESTDPSRGDGGDLGWIGLSQMPEPFAAAVQKLKKGEVTPHPVHTSFGWQVIRLDDTRALAPPSYESMREQLAATARGERVQAYVAGLLKEAQIQKLH